MGSITVPHVTAERIARVDHFSVRFHAARMSSLAALPGNPFGVELCFFGSGIACMVRHPLLAGKNRIIGFCPHDLDCLNDLLALFQTKKSPVSLSVPYGQMTQELFRRLVQAGLWSSGSGTTLVLPIEHIPPHEHDTTSPKIDVRRSGPEETEAYLDLFQQAFAHREEKAPEYRAFQWAEDSLPNAMRYIAEIDGKPVGMASLIVIDGVGYLGTAGVVPAFRGKGVQMAMIRQRITDAPQLRCDLVMGGGSLETTTYRNFERAGLRLIPTGSSWTLVSR